MKKNLMTLVLICVFFMLNTMSASADTMLAPTPYQIELDNGSKIFYMTPSGAGEQQMRSGLYYNTESHENIYFISSAVYCYEGSLVLSEDGMYFVDIPWAQKRDNNNGIALSFYGNGDLLRAYKVSELLLDEAKGMYSSSHVMWENTEKREFDKKSNTLSVTTKDDRTLLFDITTGSIIGDDPQEDTFALYLVGILAICVGILLCTAFRFFRRRATRMGEK